MIAPIGGSPFIPPMGENQSIQDQVKADLTNAYYAARNNEDGDADMAHAVSLIQGNPGLFQSCTLTNALLMQGTVKSITQDIPYEASPPTRTLNILQGQYNDIMKTLPN